jgi:uncharacterized protein YbjT (DUF2867 family)
MTKKIWVSGATGTVGGEVVRLLSKQGGVEVLAATRRPADAPALPNVRWVGVDQATGASPALLAGVDALFLNSPPGYADQYAVLSPWIRAATQARVGRVVLMTAQGVDAHESIPFRRAELELEASGLPYRILRPSWFMQNFHTFWGEGIRRAGVLEVPGGDARVGFIDARDIADVAATLLTRDDASNGTHVLTGADALTHAEAAAVLARETGRAIRYVDADPVAFEATLVRAGLPKDYAALLVNLFAAVRAGAAATPTSDVLTLLGRAPRTLAEYARDHRAQLRAAA